MRTLALPLLLKPARGLPPRSPLVVAWLGALWLGLLCNWPLWQRLLHLPELSNPRGQVFVLAFMGMVVGLLGALLSLLAWQRVIRPALTVMLLSAAAVAHFMGSYGIVVDPTMVVNIVQTDAREAGDLLSLRLLLSLLLLAGVPLLWLWRRPLQRCTLGSHLRLNLLAFGLGIGLVSALALLSFADLASTMRNNKSLRYMINPLNAYYSLASVGLRAQAAPSGPPQVVGADARLQARPGKPPLLLLVVGETARAANFSLNGYGRATNPELARREALSYRNASSCGTSTAASLPCMFSALGREAFLDQKAAQENLLDVLQRAGLAVLWLDNQSGCKGLCDRVPNAYASQSAPGAPALPPALCDGGECLDEALLQGLDQRLAALDPARVARGVVLVLHQMGSHGPAYYKRSPNEQKPFQPECRSNALQQCPPAQLMNAYDNSIAYTDRVLAQGIDWLKGQETRFAPALLYMSDHGESLGENNLYLHGMPYAIAPRDQTHVPAVLWLPEMTAQTEGVQRDCLAGQLDQAISHDSLFHTVLGFTGVQTRLYRPALDLLQPCRGS
jgi:lipid A ethanolaminephosphotransferase